MRKTNNIPNQRAFQLLEALSGVDEELLVRCEEQTVMQYKYAQNADAASGEQATAKTESGKVIFAAFSKYARKYSSSWAAVLCIAVVGALTWGGYRLTTDGFRMGMMESAVENATSVDMVATGTEVLTQESVTEGESTETIGDAGNMQQTTDAMENKGNGVTDAGETDGDAFVWGVDTELSDVRENAAKQLESLEQAREIAGLGKYIPANVPEGYAFENAHYVEKNTELLSVWWSRGMDSIHWSVQIVEDEELLHIVDLSKEETYNEYLYQIPLAETLPEEYREVFKNPVCKWEDFSLEFVQKRMFNRGADAGDTTTPRGNFAVLYPDNVLVEFNGRGTAEEIYAMFPAP